MSAHARIDACCLLWISGVVAVMQERQQLNLIPPVGDAVTAANAVLAGRAPGLVEQSPREDGLHDLLD